MLHVDWHKDEASPGHKLHKGQRYWRDGTQEEAEAIARARVAKYPEYMPEGTTQDEMVRSILRDFRPGWPRLDIKLDAQP